MTEAEIYQLIALHVEQIDAAFEFWLTISFGVLMGIHIAGNTMIFRVKLLLCTLYVTAALVSVLLSIGDLAQALEFVERLDREQPTRLFNTAAMLIRLALYFFGTATIAVAIFRYRRWIVENDT